jgi:endoglucanase
LAALIATALQPVLGGPAAAAVRPTGPLSLASGAYLGAFENPNRNDGTAGSQAEVTTLENELGRTIDIDNRFYSFNEQIPSPLETWDLQNGRIPMVTWGASDTIALADGSQDEWIRSQARRMRNLGQQVFFRFYHEPDARPTSTLHSSAQFIAAWRHVYDLFEQEGATNVIWVWCPTAWTFVSQPSRAIGLYPGDAYVDWIAVDGYNWYPGKPGSQWRSFSQVFGAFYDWAITMNKPLMIAEVGVQEDTAQPGRKAAWIADMRQQLKTAFDQFQAVLYFDTTITKPPNTYVWNLRSSTAAFNAWRDLARDPYFNPGGSTPDTTPPDVPGQPSGSSTAPGRISISWTASDDDVATSITYEVYRDGDLSTPVGTVVSSSTTSVSFTENGLAPNSQHTYQVTASDGPNTSAPSEASAIITVQNGSSAFFTETFSGGLSAWSPVTRITQDGTAGAAAPPSARAQVTNQIAFARRGFGVSTPTACLSSAVRLNSIGGANVQLLKLRAGSTNIARLVVTPARALRVRNDVTGVFVSNGPTLPTGWHTLELCVGVGAGGGTLRATLDGSTIANATGQNLGTASLNTAHIGDDTAKTYSANWDDVVARP